MHSFPSPLFGRVCRAPVSPPCPSPFATIPLPLPLPFSILSMPSAHLPPSLPLPVPLSLSPPTPTTRATSMPSAPRHRPVHSATCAMRLQLGLSTCKCAALNVQMCGESPATRALEAIAGRRFSSRLVKGFRSRLVKGVGSSESPVVNRQCARGSDHCNLGGRSGNGKFVASGKQKVQSLIYPIVQTRQFVLFATDKNPLEFPDVMKM